MMKREPPSRTTALVLFVPEADRLSVLAERVGDVAPSMRAHITLLYPFMAVDDLGTPNRLRLAELARATLPLELSFRRIGRFPGVLWLDPDSHAVGELIRTLRASWPQWPPYGDLKFKVVPHLTVAVSDDETVLDRVAVELLRVLPLPAIVRTLSLIGWRRQAWFEIERYEASRGTLGRGGRSAALRGP